MEILLKMPNLETVELKGNDINTSLWKNYKKELKSRINKFEIYSDEEEIDEEEEEAEELAEKIGKININK
jgi:hypothetical protein